jgi:cell division protein FtsW
LGFSLQPSELVKLALIIFLAAWLEYRLVVKRFSNKSTLIKFLAILGAVLILILLQPDLGTASIIGFIGLLVYFAAGAPFVYFPVFGGVAAIGAYIMIKLAPYRMARLTAFLDPSVDPQGIGYHINQALLAIGSGRFLGVGFGQSRQKFQYLPEVSADSIFAIIGEELGFLFCALFVVALVIFFLRGIKIANNAPDFFGKILATGIVGWLVFQAFINIASMLSLMPMTGVPLPFISYGGTAMMTTLAGCGILVNISKWS